MYNKQLLIVGYAQISTYPPNVRYVDDFTQIQKEARESKIGLWNEIVEVKEQVTTPKENVIPTKATYIGNANTKKYHYSTCSSVNDMKESNKVALESREDAIRGGYVPCKRCNP